MKNFIFRKKFTKDIHIHWLNTKVISREITQFIEEKYTQRPIRSVYFRDINLRIQNVEYGVFVD